MNKIIGILTLVFCIQLSVFAQKKGEGHDKMESMRIAFITQEIDLSHEEAQQFWPLYNAYQKEQKAIRREERQMRRAEDLTEAEAEGLLLKYFENKEKQLDIERTYVGKFRTIISAKQIIQLKKAEQEFKRKLLQRVGERRRRQ